MNKDFFSELKKEVLEIKDRHPHLSLDNAFVAWFLRAFVTPNEEDAVASLKGGANDKSTDAVYIDNASRLVFVIQGKYHQNSEPTASRFLPSRVSDSLVHRLCGTRRHINTMPLC